MQSTAPQKRASWPRIVAIHRLPPTSFNPLTSAFRLFVVVDRLASMRSGPRRGAVRGMSSFHESFHENASDVVHRGDAERYMQVKRGAPGRIRTCAPASGDR